MSVAEKIACVDGKDSSLSISRQCKLLRHPFYGSRKMRDCLNREGFPVNHKRVQRLMRLMGLESVAPKPNTSKRRKEHKDMVSSYEGTTSRSPKRRMYRIHP
jgi:transposase InsO family protein